MAGLPESDEDMFRMIVSRCVRALKSCRSPLSVWAFTDAAMHNRRVEFMRRSIDSVQAPPVLFSRAGDAIRSARTMFRTTRPAKPTSETDRSGATANRAVSGRTLTRDDPLHIRSLAGAGIDCHFDDGGLYRADPDAGSVAPDEGSASGANRDGRDRARR